MPNMKVLDAEYQALSDVVKNIGSVAQEKIGEYFTILETIIESAVPEGDVHAAIASFTSQASQLKDLIGPLCDEIAGDCTNYVIEVDEKDQYLY